MSFMTESGEMQFNNQYIIKNFIVRQSSSLKANDKDYKQHLNALVEKKKKNKNKNKKNTRETRSTCQPFYIRSERQQ